MNKKIDAPSAKSIEKFRDLLGKAIFIDEGEIDLYQQIPDGILGGILNRNFGGDVGKAERILFNRYREVDGIDRAKINTEKAKIFNLERAADSIVSTLTTNCPVLFITDNDNDGSLAQAVLIEFQKTLPPEMTGNIHIEYAMPIGNARGITLEVVELAAKARSWDENKTFTIVTADNGINNNEEVLKIKAAYPNATVIISDHHLPEDGLVVQEDEKTMIFNPKYNPVEYFLENNISGADTLSVLVTEASMQINEIFPNHNKSSEVPQALRNMSQVGLWANLLDYAEADIADMPVRPYEVERALSLRPLLNVATSMANIITMPIEADKIEALSKTSGVDPKWLTERMTEVKGLNILSQKLLGMYQEYSGPKHTFTEKEFYELLSEAMTSEDFTYTSINPNYIEQLRPIIFNSAVIDNKDQFQTLVAGMMEDVFSKLRKIEREILEGLRPLELLKMEAFDNSTIQYPVDDTLNSIFNRRLLGKAYNLANNGFTLMLGKVDGPEAVGSMRSLFSIKDILKNKEEFESKHNVTLHTLGHTHAAGFFITSKDGSHLDKSVFSALGEWTSNEIAQLKREQALNQMDNLEIDFDSVNLVSRINSTVKAHLAGMHGLPTVMRFKPNKMDKMWVTDNKTQKQIDLKEVVKNRRFGYQSIKTDFHNGAVVVPVEILRRMAESNFEKGIRVSFMDTGVFMGHQLVEIDEMPNLISMKGERQDEKDLIQYYKENFSESNFVDLDREDFKNIPYFKYNDHGDSEFAIWESYIIDILDTTGRDVLAVIDTEGTGLGKAPKCFNLGGSNLFIDNDSGKTRSADSFEKHIFKDQDGKMYLLSVDEHRSLLKLFEDEEIPKIEGQNFVLLTKASLTDDRSDYSTRFVFPGTAKNLELVDNFKILEDEGKVIYNRRILGTAFSFLINNGDFAITKEFENLTGISNRMVESLGISANEVDKRVDEYYRSWKNENGTPVKVIFQAHNMPYDRGIVTSNFERMTKLFNDNITSDTAKMARIKKLAYDDTPVCSFNGIEGINAKTYFYDSPFSDYSMSTFLARCERGKGGVFADIKARILLRFDAETEKFSIIDRGNLNEVELQCSLAELKDNKSVGELPNNAVRFSVERMSLRSMVRNILLHDMEKTQYIELLYEEKEFKTVLEHFQKRYHFDSKKEDNIKNFTESLYRTMPKEEYEAFIQNVNMENIADRFLDKNRSIQARFHDGWVYEKVLLQHEPSNRRKMQPKLTVEQINYYTDIPSKKIREIFDRLSAFKKAYKLDYAIVHEEHNNIRVKSSNGHGLSDTIYECVLPQKLGMFKFRNPFTNNQGMAVRGFIDQNIKRSVFQHMLGDEFANEVARDSYSMAQMLAFSRKNKSALVKKAESMIKNDPKKTTQDEIKFRLSTDILPPDSAIYAVPFKHVSQEQVAAASKDLEFIAVNEQLKCATLLSGSLDNNHCERILELANNNDDAIIKIRDNLLETFEVIYFERRDNRVKTLGKFMRDYLEGEQAEISQNFKMNNEGVELMVEMFDHMKELYNRIGEDFPVERGNDIERMIASAQEMLAVRNEDEEMDPDEEGVAFKDVMEKINVEKMNNEEREAHEKKKAKKSAVRKPTAKELTRMERNANYKHQVQNERFFNKLSIERREPLKYAINKYDLKIFLPAIMKLQEAQLEADSKMAMLRDEVARKSMAQRPAPEPEVLSELPVTIKKTRTKKTP